MRCLFGLYDECIVYKALREAHGKNKDLMRSIKEKWGSPRWVHTYCTMCMKAAYAKAKMEGARYKVINTL